MQAARKLAQGENIEIFAKSFARELLKQGFTQNDLIKAANIILDNAIQQNKLNSPVELEQRVQLTLISSSRD